MKETHLFTVRDEQTITRCQEKRMKLGIFLGNLPTIQSAGGSLATNKSEIIIQMTNDLNRICAIYYWGKSGQK